MAIPPPKAPAVPILSPEEERKALDAAHAAQVAELERVLDISLAGKRPRPGQSVELILPIGPLEHGQWPSAVLADIADHYKQSGWSKAIASATKLEADAAGQFEVDPRGTVLYLTP